MIIYKIFYKKWQLFDIEFLFIESEENKGIYYSDIKSDIIPEGIAHYIYDNVKTPEALEYIIYRCNDINDLRICLYESLDWDNYPLPKKEAEERHNKIFRPFFEKAMKDFCKEFGLGMVTD